MKTQELDLFPTDNQKEYPSSELKSTLDFDNIFDRLSHSKFRSSFYLNNKDKEYIAKRDWDIIRKNTADIISKRLAPADIPNDGRQTPMRHGIFPPFIAQHATGCCCRECFEKWHNIPKGRQLSENEQQYAVDVIMEWLKRHV